MQSSEKYGKYKDMITQENQIGKNLGRIQLNYPQGNKKIHSRESKLTI